MFVDHIVVSRESIRNDDMYTIIESNISVANYLLEEGAEPDELSSDALGSYYVDYCLTEVMNGRISQFMFSCSGDHQVLDHTAYALPLLGATEHAGLFSEVRARWDAMNAKEKRVFFDGGLFNSPDPFGRISDRVYKLNGSKDLIELNSAFIRDHPSLGVIRLERLEAHLTGITRATPDLTARLAKRERFAEENKPRYARIIDVVCEEHGMEPMHITTEDPSFTHEGEERMAQHFLTDHGHYLMVDMEGRAMMLNDDDDEIAVVDIARVPIE